MAAYRRVYDSRHLQADCQELGSTPEPSAWQSSTGYLYFFYLTCGRLKTALSSHDTPISILVLCRAVVFWLSGSSTGLLCQVPEYLNTRVFT